MAERFLLYVERAGSSYCEFDIRTDVPDAHNIVDREAWHWLARPGVIGAHVVRTAVTGGYKRSR